MKIDVIIPTRNPGANLFECLASIQAATAPENVDVNVFVCVNGNYLGENNLERQFENGRFPLSWHHVVEMGKNNALNFGISITQGDLIACLDDDVLISKNYFLEIARGARLWPEAPIYGGRVLLQWPYNLERLDQHVFSYVRSYAFGAVDPQIGPGPQPRFRPIGNNMVLRRRAMPSSTPFDPKVGPCGSSYIMGGAEHLFRELRANGAIFAYLPDALVLHIVRAEQLSYRWIFRRSFSWGRSVGYYGNNFRELDGSDSFAKLAWRYVVILSRLFRMSLKKERYPFIWAKIDLSIINGVIFQKYWSRRTSDEKIE